VVGIACAKGSTPVGDEPVVANEPTQPGFDAATSPTKHPVADAAAEASDALADAPATVPDAAMPATFVTGTAAGVSISPAYAGAVVVQSSGAAKRVVIAITLHTGFCADYSNGIDHAGEHTLVLAVIANGASTVAPATFTIGTGAASSAGGRFDTSVRVLSYDGQCQTTVSPNDEYASSGSITLTQVAGADAIGTFSLTFPNGAFSGAFDGTVCTSPGADSFACMP
jgi:hypothetical protein